MFGGGAFGRGRVRWGPEGGPLALVSLWEEERAQSAVCQVGTQWDQEPGPQQEPATPDFQDMEESCIWFRPLQPVVFLLW